MTVFRFEVWLFRFCFGSYLFLSCSPYLYPSTYLFLFICMGRRWMPLRTDMKKKHQQKWIVPSNSEIGFIELMGSIFRSYHHLLAEKVNMKIVRQKHEFWFLYRQWNRFHLIWQRRIKWTGRDRDSFWICMHTLRMHIITMASKEIIFFFIVYADAVFGKIRDLAPSTQSTILQCNKLPHISSKSKLNWKTGNTKPMDFVQQFLF